MFHLPNKTHVGQRAVDWHKRAYVVVESVVLPTVVVLLLLLAHEVFAIDFHAFTVGTIQLDLGVVGHVVISGVTLFHVQLSFTMFRNHVLYRFNNVRFVLNLHWCWTELVLVIWREWSVSLGRTDNTWLPDSGKIAERRQRHVAQVGHEADEQEAYCMASPKRVALAKHLTWTNE